MGNSDLPTFLQDIGTKELLDFATKTYKYLVNEEERMNGNELTDLRFLCRLDVSVFFFQGRYSYFINEIAATHKAGLFIRYTKEQVPRITADYAVALRAWVALHRSKKEVEMAALVSGMEASRIR